jgi:hypothetical protein
MSPRRLVNRSQVRYDRDLGEWQKWCAGCATKSGPRYWPLTLEFWAPEYGTVYCRACHLERIRLHRRKAAA